MRILILLGLLLSLTTGAEAQDKQATTSSASFLGKIFGKSEDFVDLKKQRRQLNNEINKGERDLRTIDTQIEQLTKELEEAPQTLVRLDQEVRLIDAALQVREGKESSKVKFASSIDPPTSLSAIRTEREFIFSLTADDLKGRKIDREQRRKEIGDRTLRLSNLKDEARKKRDDLDSRQSTLVELEDRIGVALNVATNQYIYRTLVSAIFAAIVFYLVSRFFRVVQDNEEVKKDIFGGDAGIQFITLFSIVIAVILFGILEILGANELSALLGGLSGYILGKTTKK
jgi:hypothetical protein